MIELMISSLVVGERRNNSVLCIHLPVS